jgi:2-polyprenyl-3-methyl-5-hydroxy-6-metoxy-1,4-benzoquinol methylase
MNLTIIIQIAVKNWNGGVDFSVKKIDNEFIFLKTINKCITLKNLISKSSNIEIILICPNRKEEKDFFELNEVNNKFKIYYGDVNDVLNRLIEVSDKYEIENILRINGSFWYLNESLFLSMYEEFSTGKFDLVTLPVNFPHGFAGEFIKVESLKRLRLKNSEIPVVNPVSTLLSDTSFKTCILKPKKNLITLEEVNYIRDKRLQYEPERAEYSKENLFIPGNIYYNIYYKSLEFISENDIVFDIASGEGYGSEIISRKAKKVYGGDYNIETVIKSSISYKNKNLNYIHADVTDIPFRDNYFDVVTSMETIEHVDENLFISNILRVLKPNGFLILTTPQNEYGFTLTPWHTKEYSLDDMRNLLQKKFDIIKIYGCSSGEIFENSEQGDRMLVVARKK